MNSPLIVGIIISVGFIFGKLAAKVKLPKVTGYILAGVALNPRIFGFIPEDFVTHTNLITNISLSLITFSIGGTLLYSRIKKLGKSIIYITIFEAELTFLTIAIGFMLTAHFFINIAGATFLTTFIPLAILLGCLGSPTDPTVTLAVTHEYKTKGKVSSTILGVAASDDALGMINYSLATVIAAVLIAHTRFNVSSAIINPLMIIAGSLAMGIVFGVIFNIITRFIKLNGGTLIVMVFGLLSLCFGASTLIKADELLATMTMGVIVVNFNEHRDIIFKTIRDYAEEMIFILFFTLSGMQLDFSVLKTYYILVILFVLFRTAGKIIGTKTGAFLSSSAPVVRKYTAWGLIPQGGIVIGLALMIKQNPAFGAISDIILGITIGATIVHELIGAYCSELALKKAGEITTTG